MRPSAALGGHRVGQQRRGLLADIMQALLATAPLLVISAEAVAIESGLGDTAVGTLLVDFTTPFPEIAASVFAVRMGSIDLAVGNLFGSHAFNMFAMLPMDLACRPGPVLAAVSRGHRPCRRSSRCSC
jgi:cation:H+ antiporter